MSASTETKPISRRRQLALVAAALLAAVAGGPTVATASGGAAASTSLANNAPVTPLRIMLTNDDGFDAPGITAVRDALVVAGHDVTIVAPQTDQSGSSGKVNFGFGSTIQVVAHSPKVFSVAGSPADAVLVGLATVVGDHPPDLVVSGSNLGQNSGGLVGHSGTVGAAVTAVEQDVPAIAVSTELDLAAGPGATIDRFDETGAFLVDVIETLQRSAEGRLLPKGRALNINYPIVTVGDQLPDSVAFTQVGQWSFVETSYQPAGADTWRIVPVFPSFDEPVRQADTTALRQDQIAVSVLDGNLGMSLRDGGSIFVRLLSLKASSHVSKGVGG